jgi:hypothetical protein
MSYSQVPDWAIIHRQDGPVGIGEDLALCRPESNVTMVATVVGPVFQLDPGEVRLWEALGLKLHRAFVVIEAEEET